MSPANPRGSKRTARRGWRFGGMDPISLATLSAVGTVLVLLSLPRLRGMALRENETDALRMMRALGDRLEAPAEPEAVLRTLGELEELPREMRPAEWVEPERLLRWHGYLFALVQESAEGPPHLVAWPWSYGESGWGAFVRTPEGALLGNPNREARWSGPGRPPHAPFDAPSAWRPVPAY